MSKMKYVAMLIQNGRIPALKEAITKAKEEGKERVWFDDGYMTYEFAEAIMNYDNYKSNITNTNSGPESPDSNY